MLLTDDVAEAGGSPLSVEDGAHVVLDVGWGCVFMIRGHPPLGRFAGARSLGPCRRSLGLREGGYRRALFFSGFPASAGGVNGVLCFSLGSRLRGNDGGGSAVSPSPWRSPIEGEGML